MDVRTGSGEIEKYHRSGRNAPALFRKDVFFFSIIMYTVPMRKLKLLSKVQFYICGLLLLMLAGCASSVDPSVLENVGNTAQLETQQEEDAVIQQQMVKDREAVSELDLYL